MAVARNVAESHMFSEETHFVARALLVNELDEAHQHLGFPSDVSPMERAAPCSLVVVAGVPDICTL